MENKNVMTEVSMAELDTMHTITDYCDGDIAIIDNIKDLTEVKPLYAKMNFIIICTKGRMSFCANDTPMTLSEGQMLISASHVVLDNYMFTADSELKILCLSDDVIQEMLRQNIINWNIAAYSERTRILSLPDEDREQLVYYYKLIRFKLDHKERRFRTIVMQAIVQSMLYDICSLMDREEDSLAPDKRSRGKVLFDGFIRLLSTAKVKRQPVVNYAAKLNITPKYLTMICTRYSGKSAIGWITQYCKEDVRYYLCHTDLTVKEVSIKLGFNNLSFFGSYVRKHFGVSPSVLKAKGCVAEAEDAKS